MGKSVNLNSLIPAFKLLIPVLIILAFLVLINLITLSDITVLFANNLKGFIKDENLQGSYFLVSIMLKLLIVLSSDYLIFVAYTIMDAISTYESYVITAGNYPFKKNDLKDVIFRGIDWNFYRLRYILLPPTVIITALLALFVLSALFFNVITMLAGINIEFTTFAIILSSLTLIFSFAVSIFMSFRNCLITSFGMECAVSEPEITNDEIRKRSRRLIFAKRKNYLFFGAYFLYLILIYIQIDIALLTPDFLRSDNILLILAVILLNVTALLMFNYYRTAMYIESLLYHYDKITLNNKKHLLDYSVNKAF